MTFSYLSQVKLEDGAQRLQPMADRLHCAKEPLVGGSAAKAATSLLRRSLIPLLEFELSVFRRMGFDVSQISSPTESFVALRR